MDKDEPGRRRWLRPTNFIVPATSIEMPLPHSGASLSLPSLDPQQTPRSTTADISVLQSPRKAVVLLPITATTHTTHTTALAESRGRDFNSSPVLPVVQTTDEPPPIRATIAVPPIAPTEPLPNAHREEIERLLRRIALAHQRVQHLGDPSQPTPAHAPVRPKSSMVRYCLQRTQIFGVYTHHEVQAMIDFFQLLDLDASDTLTIDELAVLQQQFPKQFHQTHVDIDTVFRMVDANHDGAITIHELLRLTFPQATPRQLTEMLKLAKATPKQHVLRR